MVFASQETFSRGSRHLSLVPRSASACPIRRTVPRMDDRLFTPTFVLVWIANLLQVMAFFLFIHLPGYLSDLGADEFQIGIVIGTAAISSILLRPLVGREMDRRGRRPV